jgi:hypothetical protein
MKTVVFGIFDEIADARRVLEQLARSPLDLDAVAVVHADPALQRELSDEAGLPRGRAVATGAVAGALLGGAAGAALGTWLLAPLGPLLAAAGGLLVGGACGATAAALGESVSLPSDASGDVLAAVQGGATVIMVRTANRPTARALRDLFQVAGSRILDTLTAEESPAPTTFARPADAAADTQHGDDRATGTDGDTEHAHTLFAPPWRRTPSSVRVPPGAVAAVGRTEAEVVDAPVAPVAGQSDPVDEPADEEDAEPAPPPA